jgi:copper(I)-binding protein
MHTPSVDETRRVGARLLAAAALLCAWPALAGPPADSSEVRVTGAWIRWLPAGLPAAAYLTLVNASPRPVILVGASSPAYAAVSLHQTQDHAGSMQMQAIEQVIVAPHATLRFASSGYHFMLTDPKQPIKPGDHLPITLIFADTPPLTLSFEVRRPDASDAADAGAAPIRSP